MTEIWLYPYKLKYRNSSTFREGFLLKLSDIDGGIGYSDISPWPQFGDPSVRDVPKYLKQKRSHPLIIQSLAMARWDAEARLKSLKLLKSKVVDCHHTLTQLTEDSMDEVASAFTRGFKKIKIKLGQDFGREFPLLLQLVKNQNSNKFLRLDFNGRAKKEDLQALTEISTAIEFIEDPFKSPALWAQSNLPLAFDQPGFSKKEVETSWQILKPAKQKNSEAKASNIVFTSYLDHPLGMAHGVYQALEFGKQSIEYGFMSHQVFEPNPFSECFSAQGSQLKIESDGFGIGFDSLLKNLNWEKLI